jgi:hypothetical protein
MEHENTIGTHVIEHENTIGTHVIEHENTHGTHVNGARKHHRHARQLHENTHGTKQHLVATHLARYNRCVTSPIGTRFATTLVVIHSRIVKKESGICSRKCGGGGGGGGGFWVWVWAADANLINSSDRT